MKKLLFFFGLSTVINVIIFFYRDYFQYTAYSTYADLYGECGQDCRSKWDDFLTPYPATAIAGARKLLNPLPLQPDSAQRNLKQIVQHLYQRFHRQAGDPNNNIVLADPVQFYKLASIDTTQKLWCGTWADMVSFFAWSHNIVSRNVEIMRPGDHHVLNECYLPEKKQWAMVDLTNNIVLAVKEGRLLTTQDFIQALPHPNTVSVYTGDGITKNLHEMPELAQIRDYYQAGFSYYYYHVSHPDAIYTTGSRLKRYFLPDSWYEIFSPLPKAPVLFYVKLFFIVSWVILGSLILVKRYYDRR